jgi:hypothetical protein
MQGIESDETIPKKSSVDLIKDPIQLNALTTHIQEVLPREVDVVPL